MSVKTLAIDLIKIDGGTQGRAAVNTDHVADLKAAWEASKPLPPLVVFFDGKDYWLGDGFHRLHGAKAAKRGSVPCEVRNGTVRDAQFFALTEANRGHGLKLSHEDKRAIVKRMLDDPEWGKKTTSWIAQHVGFSRPFIEELRGKPAQGATLHPGPRVGRDGKSYTKPTTKPNKLPSQSDAPPSPPEDAPTAPDEDEPAPTISGGITFDTKEIEDVSESEAQRFAAKVKAQNSAIESFARSLMAAFANPPVDPWLDEGRLNIARDQLKSACSTIRLAQAHDKPCPKCDGAGHNTGKPCRTCRGCGYLPKSSYEAAGGQ